MYLVADAGSTKVEWTLADNGQIINTIYTQGINPIHQTAEQIAAVVGECCASLADAAVERVHYYGAGCIGGEVNSRVSDALQSAFGLAPDAVSVDSDLMGAARALSGGEPSVICILGTGSNSCYFDGKNIVENTPPLGYILGDEGSGADIGKRIVSAALKGLMEDDFKQSLFGFAQCDYSGIIENIYRKPNANRYLASFARFARQHLDNERVWDVVAESFVAFVERNLLNYSVLHECKLAFVGSIAYHFRDILENVILSYGLQIDDVALTPQRGLVEAHK